MVRQKTLQLSFCEVILELHTLNLIIDLNVISISHM